MSSRQVSPSAPQHFADALAALRVAATRPQVRLTEVPAPTRIAPYAVAMTAEVFPDPQAEEELASGRFVLLHDPDRPEAWGGAWRAVTFARAELEAEFGADPMLSEVAWTWLEEALAGQGLEVRNEAGTVTRVISESFGAMSDRPASVEVEIRASWTPEEGDHGRSLTAWCDLLCQVAGLPPLPEGVVALPGRRH